MYSSKEHKVLQVNCWMLPSIILYHDLNQQKWHTENQGGNPHQEEPQSKGQHLTEVQPAPNL